MALKFHNWTGEDLKGVWLFTLKLDGVRALREAPGAPVLSRAGKPLHNLDHVPFLDAEIYRESWEKSVSMVRTRDGEPVDPKHVYTIQPLDPRLRMFEITNPKAEEIRASLKHALSCGYEGLVLRGPDKWLKVKDHETYDVVVTGHQPGKGKHAGRMGALLTEKGKVGTGFTDAVREDPPPIGSVIEVECMSLTPNGLFRHPRFKRVRIDK